MDDIGELIWQHNKEMAIESLYDDEMDMVDSYTTNMKRNDYRDKKWVYTNKYKGYLWFHEPL